MSCASVVLHATAVLAGETGILITGRSGSGKTRLARQMIANWNDRGLFARFVGDDRLIMSVSHGRVIARPHPVIAGQAEVRGLGVLAFNYEPAARIDLVVDLSDEPVDRVPAPEDLSILLSGISLPLLRIHAPTAPQSALELVRLRLFSTSFRRSCRIIPDFP